MIESAKKIKKLKLLRDLSIQLKRGHQWLFSDVFSPQELASCKPGDFVSLYSPQSKHLGHGYFSGTTHLAVRVLSITPQYFDFSLWEERLKRAASLRAHLWVEGVQTSFRLINGEGDFLPGLVCDVYHHLAVIKCDGEGAGIFWDLEFLANWLVEKSGFPIYAVYLKHKSRCEVPGKLLISDSRVQLEKQRFLENRVWFESHIPEAAKTGFFLDQRNNRLKLSQLSKNAHVLNLFAYTGGFSLFAFKGKAASVTSVDIASKAIEQAVSNWDLNQFPSSAHHAVVADVFEWLKMTTQTWDLVIVDPPSFAPNQKSKDTALKAYESLFSETLKKVKVGGRLVLSSCTAHVTHEEFMIICQKAFKNASRLGKVIYVGSQPEDHPWPLAMDELRYLKFCIFDCD
jgi:23S rRNA (cytosine1962-C5)-methyltransferase